MGNSSHIVKKSVSAVLSGRSGRLSPISLLGLILLSLPVVLGLILIIS